MTAISRLLVSCLYSSCTFYFLVLQECHIDLQKMARFAGVDLVHTEAVGVDVEKRVIRCKDGRPPIRYDVLSIDIGSTPKFVEAQVRQRRKQ